MATVCPPQPPSVHSRSHAVAHALPSPHPAGTVASTRLLPCTVRLIHGCGVHVCAPGVGTLGRGPARCHHTQQQRPKAEAASSL
eukprot:2957123-Prymnesium_polylepis.3